MKKVNDEIKQYCGFKVAGEEFAIPVMEIQEVIKPLPVTTVPLAQANVRGLINLRGQIVTCISVRKQFGLDDNLSMNYMNIIVKGREGLYSLVVDEITDIVEVGEDQVESAPDTLNSNLKRFVDRVYKRETGFVTLLNVSKLISLDNKTKEVLDSNNQSATETV